MNKIGKMIPFIVREIGEKPATTTYPATKAVMPDKFRGKLKFDAAKCIGCKICMRDCPSRAIEIEKTGEKQFKAVVYLDRCIYCGQCTDSCPRDALECTQIFELANTKRDQLKVEI